MGTKIQIVNEPPPRPDPNKKVDFNKLERMLKDPKRERIPIQNPQMDKHARDYNPNK